MAAVAALGVYTLWPHLWPQFTPLEVHTPAFVIADSPASAAKASLPAQPISLNQASQSQLESLPGVGPALAQRIMASRPFSSVEDLQKVKGIGPKTFEKLRPLVSP